MSRSSYKGLFFCNKTIAVAYKNCLERRATQKYKVSRSTNIPNTFVNFIGVIPAGRGLIRFPMRPTTAARKAGIFAFNRKPFVFPVKKRRKVK
jgi:hypothetical protein